MLGNLSPIQHHLERYIERGINHPCTSRENCISMMCTHTILILQSRCRHLVSSCFASVLCLASLSLVVMAATQPSVLGMLMRSSAATRFRSILLLIRSCTIKRDREKYRQHTHLYSYMCIYMQMWKPCRRSPSKDIGEDALTKLMSDWFQLRGSRLQLPHPGHLYQNKLIQRVGLYQNSSREARENGRGGMGYSCSLWGQGPRKTH